MTDNILTLSNELPDILRTSGIKSKGFGITPKYAMLDTDLTIQTKGIYAYFCSFTGRGNCAFPGRDRILKDLQLSKDTYYNHFNLLTKQGYITVTQERAQQFFKNIYTIESYPIKFCIQEKDALQNKVSSKIRMEGIDSLGYGIIPKIVMIDSRLDIKAKAIYAYLCVFSGSGQNSYPKISNILHHLGIAKNTYYKHFNSLMELDYIKVEQRRINGKLSSNDYFLVSNPNLNKKTPSSNNQGTEKKQCLPTFSPCLKNQSPCLKNQDTRETQCLSGFSPCLKNQDTRNQDTRNQDTRNQDTNINSFNINSFNINQSIHQQSTEQELMDGIDKKKERYYNDYRKIMDGLGRGGRMPATKERQCINKWMDEYSMPLQIILEACDRTIMNTNKRVFAYCDKILTNWYEKGVVSLDDISRVNTEFAQNARSASLAHSSKRFANFKQREWDFEEVERVDRAYQELKKEKKSLSHNPT